MTTHTLELLKEPYGYFDEDCLAFGGTIPRRLELTQVHMVHDGEAIGLDSTEWLLPPGAPHNPAQRCINNNVRVWGIFEVKKVEWLSEKGQQRLQSLMRKRDNQGRQPGIARSILTLDSFYATLRREGYDEKVKILLSFVKNMNARSEEDNAGVRTLCIHSVENRAYIVKDADVAFFNLSINWHYRYQLFYLMKKLIRDAKVQQPIEARTIHWFVKEYNLQIRNQTDEHQRLIFSTQRDDDDPDPTPLTGDVPHRRYLRHIASADIRGRFADQCEWLLANQIASASSAVQLFDTKSWVKWCKEVQKLREETRDQLPRPWGVARNTRLEDLQFSEEDPFGLERFGGKAKEWADKLKNALNRAAAKPKNVQPQSEIPFSVPVKKASKRKRKQRATQFIYDDDFSDSSTDSYFSDSEDDAELSRKINLLHFQRPSLPHDNLNWHCTYPECYFTVDMREITTSKTHDCRREHLQVLSCPAIYEIFIEKVNTHLLDKHLDLDIHIASDKSVYLLRRGETRPPRESSGPRRGARERKPRIKAELD
ncbi:hypothetical protein DFP72DRAFT_4863 [Ephemerocybe angulata]|uniref:Uncharacterized protein n=1 Tax=Ephemerocybe angulata TaxID=980116 RepID=A0A8H6MGP9_9AGAR|nr:hypothetical protein DFP72DRAFT_4863 [Tulosesus angulatus]